MKKNKEIIRLVIAGVAGFAIAMIIMAADIYMGYTKAYSTGAQGLNVTLFALPIYNLKLTKDIYVGSSLGQNMGIISIIFAAFGIALERIVHGWRKHGRE